MKSNHTMHLTMSVTALKLNRAWTESEYVVLDIEGTGAQHKEKEGIVDIAGVLIKNGLVTQQCFQKMLNPEISIPFFISKIHGITNQNVAGKPKFADVQSQILDFLDGRILVGHNAAVERRVLRLKMPDFHPLAILDTLKLSRRVYCNEKKHGLDEIIKRLNLELRLSNIQSLKRHSAYYDALATAYAFVELAQKVVGASGTLDELFSYGLLD